MLKPDESIDNAKNLVVKKNIKAFYFDCDNFFLLKFVRFLQKWAWIKGDCLMTAYGIF